MKKNGLTLIELLLVIALIGILVALALASLARTQEGTQWAGCQSNLKQWGMIFLLYSREDAGDKLPPMQAELMTLYDCGSLTPTGNTDIVLGPSPSLSATYPEYLTDPALLVCPSNLRTQVERLKSPNGEWEVLYACDNGSGTVTQDRGIGLAHNSYVYFGWAFDRCRETDTPMSLASLGASGTGPAQFVAAFGKVTMDIREGDVNAADRDIDVTAVASGEGNNGSNTVFRLQQRIGRFLVSNWEPAVDMSSRDVWVLSDCVVSRARDMNHARGGCNVVYMDGHVEFIRYPGRPPVNEGMANAYAAVMSRNKGN